MRRRYAASRYSQALDLIRDMVPDVAITADVIVGFPGETDSDFEDTFRVCQESEFAAMHVFPYSTRPGTSAAHFQDSVPPETKIVRSARLLEHSELTAKAFRRRFIGETRPVLWERRVRDNENQTWTGLTDNYMRVTTVCSDDLGNQITDARILDLDGITLKTDTRLA